MHMLCCFCGQKKIYRNQFSLLLSWDKTLIVKLETAFPKWAIALSPVLYFWNKGILELSCFSFKVVKKLVLSVKSTGRWPLQTHRHQQIFQNYNWVYKHERGENSLAAVESMVIPINFKNYLFSGTVPSKIYLMSFIPLTTLLNLTGL